MNFNIVAAEAASTVDSIKSGAISTIQWLGHQISALKDTVVAAITKIIEYVKPLFTNIAQYFGEIFEAAKEWIKENRELATYGGIGSLAAAFAVVGGYLYFSKEKD